MLLTSKGRVETAMPGLVPTWQIQLTTAEKFFSDRAKACLAKPTKSTPVSTNDVSTIFAHLSISRPPPPPFFF